MLHTGGTFQPPRTRARGKRGDDALFEQLCPSMSVSAAYTYAVSVNPRHHEGRERNAHLSIVASAVVGYPTLKSATPILFLTFATALQFNPSESPYLVIREALPLSLPLPTRRTQTR